MYRHRTATLHAHAYRALDKPPLAETPEGLKEWNAALYWCARLRILLVLRNLLKCLLIPSRLQILRLALCYIRWLLSFVYAFLHTRNSVIS